MSVRWANDAAYNILKNSSQLYHHCSNLPSPAEQADISTKKQARQEDEWAPCCLGLKVILEIRAIIIIEDTFQNLPRTLKLSIFKKKKKKGYTSPMLLQYSPDVRKLWDGQLWFCEEILRHGTCWETMSHQQLKINSPIIYLWPGILHQKQLVTLCLRDTQINWMLI